ncbi:MAG: hypothetical protein MJZ34_10635 [Paludibacteraceae bacterium]|nr:hypothetical protein [Paludibacteraceae bacterium]
MIVLNEAKPLTNKATGRKSSAIDDTNTTVLTPSELLEKAQAYIDALDQQSTEYSKIKEEVESLMHMVEAATGEKFTSNLKSTLKKMELRRKADAEKKDYDSQIKERIPTDAVKELLEKVGMAKQNVALVLDETVEASDKLYAIISEVSSPAEIGALIKKRKFPAEDVFRIIAKSIKEGNMNIEAFKELVTLCQDSLPALLDEMDDLRDTTTLKKNNGLYTKDGDGYKVAYKESFTWKKFRKPMNEGVGSFFKGIFSKIKNFVNKFLGLNDSVEEQIEDLKTVNAILDDYV